MTTSQLRTSINRSPWRLGFLLIPFLLSSFALSTTGRAQLPSPSPDGGYPDQNTAEGDGALFSLTSGSNNTAIGFDALNLNTTGFENTANGTNALYSNTTGNSNTANGVSALYSNTTGNENTGTGVGALQNNTIGTGNTASGYFALESNTTGDSNTANGDSALVNNFTGSQNTATGLFALQSNTTGNSNTATGYALLGNTTGNSNTATGVGALISNTTGNNNTATGRDALSGNITGSSNIGIGFQAGLNLTTRDNNIDIGNPGVAGEANATRIGTQGTQTKTFIAGIIGVPVAGATVHVNGSGQLGIGPPSSARFERNIEPMDNASEAILGLKPVTFNYKKEIDPDGIPQFGLVAEEVEKVARDLVARNDQGNIYTVRYEAVNAMLLNEFLKEHHLVQEQQNRIEKLTAELKEQAAQIRKVNDKVDMIRPAPQVVLNNQ